jgi:penicillin-binding protein 1A
MRNVTGGSIPAATWHDIMAYALQGVPIKPIVGMAPATPDRAPAVATSGVAPLEPGAQRPATLSRGAIEALDSIQSKIRAIDEKHGDAGGQPAAANGPTAGPPLGLQSARRVLQ